MTVAYVVGSGPNGLAAAIELARAGLEVTVLESHWRVGGAVGSAELTHDGLVHDLGASFVPLAVRSPFFRSLDLDALGVRFRHAPIELAHPLDDGSAGVLHRDVSKTAEGFGTDGALWRNVFGPFANRFDDLLDDVMHPLLRVPRHPALMARFGMLAAQSATHFGRSFRTDQARALWSGVAAHAFTDLEARASSAIGLMLVSAAHAGGWPVVEGGAQVLTDALVRKVVQLGGRIETGRTVTDVRELSDADVVLLDVAPSAAIGILHDAIPSKRRRAFDRYRHGPAAYKVDFAVDGEIPWRSEECGRAGVVHLGGTAEDVAEAEKSVVGGRSARKPFTLVGQQYLADPGRSRGSLNPVWAYAHVPYGTVMEHEHRIVKQIERFAPGFRERIVSTHVTSAMGLAAANSNFVGGDINTGANTFAQLIGRPTVGADPYATGVKGVYLCSAATPPGPGVHGMSGANAAAAAIRHL
ncbi:phytoene dehydrogenase-like protein [Curtobacterium herbarum]|uniref:phytoene desaturase family protein n=1 Tax=Curtobacterium herbarum TaxID=150122 RepID=UPI00209E09A9|nr:NAD(P)/FAD-dependent oxidoreductase [Curtobacterium herbarum]MCP1502852.1 phytoene dehydrogenase-like protein [Curtobacterium herbarum]